MSKERRRKEVEDEMREWRVTVKLVKQMREKLVPLPCSLEREERKCHSN